jgi:fructosamine-3-kinase
MDLSMTRLFGGFDVELYTAFHVEWPMELNWEGRTDLCDLYPLLVHVNLLGGALCASVGGGAMAVCVRTQSASITVCTP